MNWSVNDLSVYLSTTDQSFSVNGFSVFLNPLPTNELISRSHSMTSQSVWVPMERVLLTVVQSMTSQSVSILYQPMTSSVVLTQWPPSLSDYQWRGYYWQSFSVNNLSVCLNPLPTNGEGTTDQMTSQSVWLAEVLLSPFCTDWRMRHWVKITDQPVPRQT